MLWTDDNFLPAHNAYEDGKECSETSAYKIHTPGASPKTKITTLRLIYLVVCFREMKKKANIYQPAEVVSASPHHLLPKLLCI